MLPELTAENTELQPQSATEDGRSGRSLRIPELDGIRGIAILLVMLLHYVGFNPPETPRLIYYIFMVPIFSAETGVDLFFVLSGFLIGGILMDNRDTINYFQVFYIRRFYRIIPLYAAWIGLFLLFSMVVARFVSLPAELIEHTTPLWTYLTFTQNIAMAVANTFGGPEWLAVTWSLAVEEQFYLTLPLFLYLVPHKRLPIILPILIVSVFFLRYLHLEVFWRGIATYVLTPYRIDALLLGVLCAWMVRKEDVRIWLVQHSRWLYVPLLAVGAWCYWLAVKHPGDVTQPVMAIYGLGSFDVMFALFLLIAVTEPRGPIKFITGLKPLRFLGLLAYGIYLFHQTVNILMHHFILHDERGFDTPERMLVTVLSFGVTVLLAYLSWVYFEKRLVAMGHRHQYVRQESVPAAAETPLAVPTE